MAWQDQGRQEHGHFGHGTAPHDITDDDKAELESVAYSVIGELSDADRRRYEGWLHRGGLQDLAAALLSWSAESDLPSDEFRVRQFGTYGDSSLAARAQKVGATLDAAEPGDAGRRSVPRPAHNWLGW